MIIITVRNADHGDVRQNFVEVERGAQHTGYLVSAEGAGTKALYRYLTNVDHERFEARGSHIRYKIKES
jgi:hypothetical protein